MDEKEKEEVINVLKQLEGIKRKLHALLKGDAKCVNGSTTEKI